jgi:hypothetical protein
LRAVVSDEAFDQDRQKLLSTVETFEKRARILAATVRLLLPLLRASGFRFVGERLPQCATKASILRAVTSAHSALPLALILRILGMQPSRYHAWRRVAVVCGLDDRSPCPRTVSGDVSVLKLLGDVVVTGGVGPGQSRRCRRSGWRGCTPKPEVIEVALSQSTPVSSST